MIAIFEAYNFFFVLTFVMAVITGIYEIFAEMRK